jgi:protocatechuate 3,4-dioxygenase beta subunit
MSLLRLLLLLIGCPAALWAQSADTTRAMQQAAQALHTGQQTANQLVGDPAYVFLHEYAPFKALLQQYARESRISPLWPGLKGVPFTLRVQLVDKANRPVPGVTVLVFQTDRRGYYFADTTVIPNPSKAENQSRLFAYGKTDAQGRLEVRSIRPGGYPYLLRGRVIPGHFHLTFFHGGDTLGVTTFFLDQPQFGSGSGYREWLAGMQQRFDPTQARELVLGVVPRRQGRKQTLQVTLPWAYN